MNIGPMAEVDCNAFQASRGIAKVSESFTNNGRLAPTAAIHANKDLTLWVRDTYGNITKKVMVGGLQVVGAYLNVWVAASGDTITTKPTAGDLNLIF